MPIDFPDMDSLEWAAKNHKFRELIDGETEEEYRKALHLHVKPIDKVESFEILFGIGWDKFNDAQKLQLVLG